jgi:hypothetical protein
LNKILCLFAKALFNALGWPNDSIFRFYLHQR